MARISERRPNVRRRWKSRGNGMNGTLTRRAFPLGFALSRSRFAPLGFALSRSRFAARASLSQRERLGNRRDCFGNRFYGEIGLFFINDQRRTETNRRSAGAENQQPTAEAVIKDLVTKLARCELNADHETAAANIDDGGLPVPHALDLGEQVFPHPRGIRDIFFFQEPDGFQGGRQTYRISAECRSMGARFPRHDFRASHRYAQRHAGGDTFRDGDDVRMKVEMFEREHLPGATHTALDFVGNQENAVLAGDLLELWKKIRRRNDIAAFALNGFDHNRRNFTRIDSRSKNHILQMSRVAERDMSDARNERTEPPPLNRLR